MKTDSNQPAPVRVQPVVGWLWWGIRIGVHLGLMASFAVDMIVSINRGQYADALVAGALSVIMCPAWDQPANEKGQR